MPFHKRGRETGLFGKFVTKKVTGTPFRLWHPSRPERLAYRNRYFEMTFLFKRMIMSALAQLEAWNALPHP
ncbi:hypothetical protein, partial [Pseudomonas sp. No.117]